MEVIKSLFLKRSVIQNETRKPGDSFIVLSPTHGALPIRVKAYSEILPPRSARSMSHVWDASLDENTIRVYSIQLVGDAGRKGGERCLCPWTYENAALAAYKDAQLRGSVTYCTKRGAESPSPQKFALLP